MCMPQKLENGAKKEQEDILENLSDFLYTVLIVVIHQCCFMISLILY